jgi:hypothetical protein
MLVISDKLVMQLVLPPGMALVYLWMGRNILISTSRYGVLTPSRTRMLRASVFSLLLFMYGVTFNRELRALWIVFPFAIVGIVASILFFVVWGATKWWRSSQEGSNQMDQTGDAAHRDPSRADGPLHELKPPSLDLRVRQWTILIWALLGIAGTLAAILWKLLRK